MVVDIIQIDKDVKEFLKHSDDLHFYIIYTSDIIDSYKKELDSPVQINFLGKRKKQSPQFKNDLISEYLKIAKTYKKDINIDVSETSNEDECPKCKSKNILYQEELAIVVCQKCSRLTNILCSVYNFDDSERIHSSPRYMYDRKTHFRDCIYQYQGKQNYVVPPEILSKLQQKMNEFKLTPKTLKKSHVLMFLKEDGLSKQYENVHLIHHKLTGVKLPDISHLEDKLITDFEILTNLYDSNYKTAVKRKNFISSQYVLYQLLTKHKFKCNKEDFELVKTADRKNFRNEICKQLFNHLGWPFSSK